MQYTHGPKGVKIFNFDSELEKHSFEKYYDKYVFENYVFIL